MHQSRNSNWRERLSTVHLLIKEACFVRPVNNIVDRHEQYCLEIFVKRDELKLSSMEGPFNEILTDR